MTRYKILLNMSIRNKLILIVLSVIILVQTIGFVFIIIWDINRIKDEAQTGLILNTKLVANNCVVPLTFGDKLQASQALSHLQNIESVEIACLIDIEGNIFATYPDSLNKKDCPGYSNQENNEFIDSYFYVYEPVMFNNEQYGTLVVKANSESLKTARNNIILTMILLGVLLNILAAFLAIRLQRYISKPLVDLKTKFNKIAENQDFSVRVVKPSNDEIGQLYTEFNGLLEQIQNRRMERDIAEQELKKHKETLEQIVKERTKNLEEKNIELESFNQLFIDREYRIKELRDELEKLKENKKNK